MGEAKRKKLIEQQQPSLDIQAVECVGLAMRKLAQASSTHLGSDCYLHTVIGQHLFLKLGIKVEIVVGFAAWRVGQSDGSVVSHVADVKGYLPPGMQGFAYHAWLTHGNKLIDLTTYQLRQKAADLDAMDGGFTDVQWCPDFLVVDRKDVSTYKQVAQGDTGLFYYERNTDAELKISSGFTLDPEDLRIAELIMSSSDLVVIGPNQMK